MKQVFPKFASPQWPNEAFAIGSSSSETFHLLINAITSGFGLILLINC